MTTQEKNREYLKKATLTTSDLVAGGLLAPEQADTFLELAIKASVITQEAVTRIMSANKWQEPQLSWGGRILRAATEGSRLASADRVKPNLGQVELSTVLVKGEVPVTDEVLEDNIRGAAFADDLAQYAAQKVGSDLEELFVRGNVTVTGAHETAEHDTSADAYLALLDGLLVQAEATAGHTYDATGDGTDYRSIFDALIKSVPEQYRRNAALWRFYVSPTVKENYHSQVADRATAAGDAALQQATAPPYKGVQVVQVPWMPDNHILFIQPSNIYIGFQRQVRLETFRDPREGVTSLIVTCRADVKIPVVDATAVAQNVST